MTPVAASNLRLVTPTRGDAPHGAALTASIPAGVDWRVVSPSAEFDWHRFGATSPVLVPEPEGTGGMYAALNAGLASPGPWEWFSYVNDDDLLGVDMAELIRLHCRPGNENVIAYGRVAMLAEDGRELYQFPTTARTRDFDALLPQGIMPFTQQGMVAHRQVWEQLGGFDASYMLAGDLDFWVRAWQAGFAFRFYRLRVGAWRLRPGQLSSRREDMWAEQNRCLAQVRKQRPGRGCMALAKGRFRLENFGRYILRFWHLRRLRQSAVFTTAPMASHSYRAPSTSRNDRG